MKKSLMRKPLIKKSAVEKPLVRKLLEIAQLFSMFTIALILMGSPVGSLHAEQVSPAVSSTAAAVNINTATSVELAEALNGIGAKKAQAIVEYRNQHGPYTDANQLLNVKGIGEATLSKNSEAIVLK